MLENDFLNWLLKKYDEKTATSRKTNCLTVCKYEGDLDIHFEKDNCRKILSKLAYSTDDERHNRRAKHKIPINGNIRNGTATLKQAVKLYIQFRMDRKNGNEIDKPGKKEKIGYSSKEKAKSNWPVWELPTEDEIYQLAQVTTKYIRFLNPLIIEKITEDNKSHYEEWHNILTKNKINPELYLWELSPCCFPGIRRHAGSREIAHFKKQIVMQQNEIPNALRLDDNDFPKQIWSFIFRGKQFSKSGPNDYSLAHLIDHKKSKNRMSIELELKDKNYHSETFYGLYTCPTNTIYIPNSLLKPTDFNSFLRQLLFQKAWSLYKNYCNILPPYVQPKTENKKWDINNFKWGETVGNMDNINIFLEYRNKIMDSFK